MDAMNNAPSTPKVIPYQPRDWGETIDLMALRFSRFAKRHYKVLFVGIACINGFLHIHNGMVHRELDFPSSERPRMADGHIPLIYARANAFLLLSLLLTVAVALMLATPLIGDYPWRQAVLSIMTAQAVFTVLVSMVLFIVDIAVHAT